MTIIYTGTCTVIDGKMKTEFLVCRCGACGYFMRCYHTPNYCEQCGKKRSAIEDPFNLFPKFISTIHGQNKLE